MEINPSIFKAYDIRGIYPSEINEETVYRIGRAIITFLKAKTICIGRDVRISSPALAKSLIKGFTDQGADVTDIGVCSTPMLYFSVGKNNFDAGVMLTASHNPKEYNGIKITKEQAIPIGGNNGMENIKNLVRRNSFFEPQKKGRISIKSFFPEYKKFLLDQAGGIKKLKVVIDTANSALGPIVKDIFSELPIEIYPLYFEPDGNFPNHEANPLKHETLKALQEKILDKKADLGIAFDGDGDRVFFVDEKARIIPADFATAMIAQNVLKSHPKANIFYDLRSSWVVKEEIEKAGGNGLMCRVGHAFIKQQMRDDNGVFAGELAGHYYFKENYFAESALLASIKMMQEVSKTKLSELSKNLQRYYSSGELNFEVQDKKKVLDRIEQAFSKNAISHLDGIRIETEDFWFNIRESNTEPLIRLNCEAKTKQGMEEIKNKIIALINAS